MLKLLLLRKLLKLLLLRVELVGALLLGRLPPRKYISELVGVEERVNAVDEGLEECSIPPLRRGYPSLRRGLLSRVELTRSEAQN